VITFYRAGLNTDRIAHLTGISRRRVTEIVNESIGQALEEAGTDGIRRQLYAELEMLKAPFRDAFFFHSDDASPRERARLANIIIRLIHEQAVLMGVQAPRQVAITSSPPPVNEEALAFSRDVVRFMDLSDKIAASGYGSGRTELAVDPDLLLETDVQVTTGNLSYCWRTRPEPWKKIQYPSPCGQPVDSKVVPAGGRTTMTTDRITMRQAAQELLERTDRTLLAIWGGEIKASDIDTWTMTGFRQALIWVLSYKS